ncbi:MULTISPECIES: AraC family transcriptional regulator [unclassified Breznakia]|uniref:AraC family transcriptional regulator n=1 Tax=unclassified Breznakia TaxID=2623764 RepID=UPI002473A55A|nr:MULTISPECIES: AraC family transcriptional regulator [unclassified Breznakia]MDH6366792.1 AraC-like DNA-binding protein/mannose-6-phosphate isomerase-like protein (cupin superfamily) [Breznakia sp. PH1-1]MDH6403821.1 AraC-like DNA-binding protein/mannose-6-phosphate isomerase-like protein (cupin superfamily) [Breznakia sp. PF1-11]MDH6411530.1 AraC-like DNA-binding protein/mannose-6-phosphate isomerase-like protein (cupin superfamily) [Breznakia sp. PFB1-11]MDH6413894.1 AraC-like DNA-binding p
MIYEDILEKLLAFTNEEIDNLNGKKIIDKSIYVDVDSHVIDFNKILHDSNQIAVRKHTRFKEYPKHKHNYLELMYVYQGSMTHIIDDREIIIRQGEIMLLNQNIEHEIKFAGENDLIFNFIIPSDFLNYLSSLVAQDNLVTRFVFEFLFSYSNDGEYLCFHVADDQVVTQQIETIITAIYRPSVNNQVALKLHVGLLLVHLMNAPEKIETYSMNSYDKVLSSSILKYIALNYQEGSLTKLANQIHQPDYKISKVIKSVTGKTFKQLVQETRLQKACEYLVNTNLPVYTIMNNVGYENLSFFYRMFKDTYHTTPQKYREFAK